MGERKRLSPAELHDALDQLLGAYLRTTDVDKGPSNTSVMELLEWSHEQVIQERRWQEHGIRLEARRAELTAQLEAMGL